jgi:hypothetical protein
MKLQHAVFVVFVCGAGVLLLNPAAWTDALKINEAWSAPEAGNQYMPSAPCALAPYQVAMAAEPDEDDSTAQPADARPVRSNKKNGQHTAGASDSSKVKKTDLIEAEVTAVLSPNEIEVNMLGKHQVIKLAGVKDCPCDFNEQATKIAHAETKASKGFTVIDAGTVVRRCREIKDILRDSIADQVQIKLSSTRRDSSGRLTGIVWNKGKSKTLNDTVQSYTQKQGVSEKKKGEHHSYKKFKAKNK